MFHKTQRRALLYPSLRRKVRSWRRHPASFVQVAFFTLLVFTFVVSFATSGTSSADVVREKVRCTCLNRHARLQSLEFFKQTTFNVCEVACDSNGVFTSRIEETSTVERGIAELRGATVEVCMLCRDAEESIPNITRRLQQLSSYVRSLHVTFIENDSVDGTKRALHGAMLDLVNTSTNIDVSVESHSLNAELTQYGSRKFPPARIYDSAAFEMQRAIRYHRMSILRNRCLLEAMKRPRTNYLFVNDADEDLNTDHFAMDGIAHSFGLHGTDFNWNVVCANGVGVPKKSKIPRLQLHRNASEAIPRAALDWVFWDSLAYRDGTYNKSSWRTHQLRIHSIYDEPVAVESCFGGLAIYDIGSSREWHKCSYAGHTDNDCEHVSFNNCLREHGWKVLFNPRMLVNYVRP